MLRPRIRRLKRPGARRRKATSCRPPPRALPGCAHRRGRTAQGQRSRARASPASWSDAAAGSRRARRSLRPGLRSRRHALAARARAPRQRRAQPASPPARTAGQRPCHGWTSIGRLPQALHRRKKRIAGDPIPPARRQLERPQCRHREARNHLGEQRECEPAPGAATYRKKLGQFRRAPGERDGGERCGGARKLHDEPLIMATDGDAADRREDGKCDAKQHEPGCRMVEPWHKARETAAGRLVAIRLRQAVLPFREAGTASRETRKIG